VLASQTTSQLFVWKSTDGGLTWAALDALNGPVNGAGNNGPAWFSPCYDGASLIHVALQDWASNSVLLCDFDLVSETWGAVYGAGGPSTENYPYTNKMQAFARPGGAVLVVYEVEVAGPAQHCRAAEWTGLAWLPFFSLETNMPVGTVNSYNPQSIIDASGAVHVVMACNTLLQSVAFYQKISPSNALTTFSTILTDADFVDFNSFHGLCETPNALVLGNLDLAQNVGVLLGTPASAPVVWVQVQDIDTPPVLSPNATPFLVFDSVAARLHLCYVQNDGNGLPTIIRHLFTDDLVTYSGWTAETIFNPAGSGSPLDFPGQYMDLPTFSVASLHVAFDAIEPISYLQQRYYFNFGGAPPSPPVISCGAPPDGTVGTVYSHGFPVVGGTAPLVFSIVAGALPPGLALDAATGTVFGTPTTAGPYPFTVQVTDAAALSSQAACSITVAPALVSLQGLRIILRGVKRTRQGQDPELCACAEPEHVQRAV
jgi:hypothetical protein